MANSYDPFYTFRQLQQEINRLLEAQAPRPGNEDSYVATSRWVPAVDIQETADRFIILADFPGVDPEQVDITMENGVLTLKGERGSEQETQTNDYKRVERVRGSFYRRFSLPDTADAARISAKSAHGVLEITLPKREQMKPRRIAIER